MTNKGVFEQLLDKMPYVMGGGLGIACIITLIYGVYSSCKEKYKRDLLISVIYFINIIFGGFLAYVITEIIQMEAGEHLSIKQQLNLVVAIVGMVVFNVFAYRRIITKK